MSLKKRMWYWLGAFCILAALWFWFGSGRSSVKREARGAGKGMQQSAAAQGVKVQRPAASTQNAGPGGGSAATTTTNAIAASASRPATGPQGRFPFRLTNTDQPLSKLGRSDSAILLDNAFIDTASQTPLVVPEQLRAKGDPGSYLVQSRGPLDGTFYTLLRNAGAEFVSYIPNNAGLVRVSADGARQLAALPGIRAVMPYEPYYKLAQPLLALAMQNQSLPLDRSLNVTFFPGAKDGALAALRNLGAE